MVLDANDPMSVMEAVDHLSDMAEINPHSSWLVGIAKPFVFEDFSEEILWHNPSQIIQNKTVVRETFLTLYQWLKNFAEMQNELLKTSEVRMILKGIISLAHEAIEGMDHYMVLFPNAQESFAQLPEYHQLIKFYSNRIERGRKKEEKKEGEELPIKKYLFPDLESLRRDLQYEQLFLKTAGELLYDQKLLKHLQIVGNFDELFLSQDEEQPFLRIHEVLEHHAYEGAKGIVERSATHTDDFYKEAMHHKNRPYIASLNKALMALRMAANSKLQETEKTCLEYYNDFHFFIRLSMQVPGYRERLIAAEIDPFSHVLLSLTHALCAGVFLRTESSKEPEDLMRYFIERGKVLAKIPKVEKATIPKELKIWVELIQADRAFRGLLKFYPNGPLMKTFMFIQQHPTSFDPLLQYLPCQLFAFTKKDMHVTVLRLSSPTYQEDLQNCSLAEEFQGFLRYYLQELKPDKHILFNLQDRNHTGSVARCETLEKTAEQKEFSKVFFLISLPKTNDFYLQNGEFEQISGSPIFFESCLSQVFGGKEKGFIFPSFFNMEEFRQFAKQALDCIHQEFFQGKETLSQRERRDFIEFFYQLIILKCIQDISPDSISFTCKDAVDLGPTQTAFFYAILNLFSKKEPDFETLLWLFFWPALSIRNRSLEPGCLHRSIQCLFFIHTKLLENPKAIEKINGLYHSTILPVEIKRI